MIPDQWYPLIESVRVKRRPTGVVRMGQRLVLWRDGDGQIVCMPDRCPHRGVALSRGRVRDGQLQCGYHGFRFDKSGACVLMPCEGPEAKIPRGLSLRAHTVREAYGLVWYWNGDAALLGALPEIPWFDSVGDRRRGTADGSLIWPQNQVRTTESNFDLHHTPWLHGSIVPVGTRLDPYEVEVRGTDIVASGELRREGRERGMPFRVEFKFPSVTYIALSNKLYFVNADCPVDERSTWRFVRYYQDYVGIPGLGRALAWLALQLEWRVVQMRQDLPMVRTQDPPLPDQNRDHLVRADAGTAAYLKLRRQLLAQSEERDAAPASVTTLAR